MAFCQENCRIPTETPAVFSDTQFSLPVAPAFYQHGTIYGKSP